MWGSALRCGGPSASPVQAAWEAAAGRGPAPPEAGAVLFGSAPIEFGIEIKTGCTSSILGGRRLFFDHSQVCAVARPLLIGAGCLVQEAEGAAKTLVTLDLTLDGGP